MKLPAYRELTDEQVRLIDAPYAASCLITGPPGSGKTIVGLYRAGALKRRGFNPRFLMYNVALSAYVASAASELRIGSEVTTFHKFMHALYQREFGRNPPALDKFVFDWQSIYRDLNTHSLRTDPNLHLIVDEGQDLPYEFYLVARLLSKAITVFADGNQTITETSSTISQIKRGINVGPNQCYHLTGNSRNTREIAAFAASFGLDPDEARSLPARQGPKPLLERHAGLAVSAQRIVGWNDTHRAESIGVFTFTRQAQQKLENHLRSLLPEDVEPQVYDSGRPFRVDFEDSGIFLFNVHSAKGLEFDTVFLVELQEARVSADESALRAQLYVGCTRARSHLFLSYTGEHQPPIVGQLPTLLYETVE